MYFDAAFNRQKTRTVTKPWDTDLWFNREMKLTKQCKNYPQKFMVRPNGGGGGRTIVPLKYATVSDVLFVNTSE